MKDKKPVDYTSYITRNSKGTVLSVPVSALHGYIRILPTIKPSAKKEVK
jgi:hypothetical protein